MRSGHLEGYPHFKTFVSAKAEMDQISRWLASYQNFCYQMALIPFPISKDPCKQSKLNHCQSKLQIELQKQHHLYEFRVMWKGIWLQLFEICPRCVLMCFFRLWLQSFLERKSREAACFPSHGDWLNVVTRPAQRTQCRKVYNDHPPWSEMCHILSVWAQCATMCFITAPLCVGTMCSHCG